MEFEDWFVSGSCGIGLWQTLASAVKAVVLGEECFTFPQKWEIRRNLSISGWNSF